LLTRLLQLRRLLLGAHEDRRGPVERAAVTLPLRHRVGYRIRMDDFFSLQARALKASAVPFLQLRATFQQTPGRRGKVQNAYENEMVTTKNETM